MPLYHQDGFLLLSPSAMQPGGFEHESFALLAAPRPSRPNGSGPAISNRAIPGLDASQISRTATSTRAPAGSRAAKVARHVSRRRPPLTGVRPRRRESRSIGSSNTDAARRGRPHDGSAELRADAVLVAAGAWTPALLPHLADVMWAVGQPVVHFEPWIPRRLAGAALSGLGGGHLDAPAGTAFPRSTMAR